MEFSWLIIVGIFIVVMPIAIYINIIRDNVDLYKRYYHEEQLRNAKIETELKMIKQYYDLSNNKNNQK